MDLRNRNRSADQEIIAISEREHGIVITKDADFVNSFLLTRKPFKLLFISTGNIGNTDLEKLLVNQIPAIASAFETFSYIELTRTTLVFHV